MKDIDLYEATQDQTGDQSKNHPRMHGEAAQWIGRYRIQRVLGKGGFGNVYLAHDEQLNRLVAIKVPHARLISKSEDAEGYLAEARTVANLDHPGIVPVYDVGKTDEFPCYIVSKYIEGSDLSTGIKNRQLTYDDAAELIAAVAEALHYAHKKGLVHRDVKPGNLLLDTSGKPFVADFGLALREEDVGKGPGFAGTPAYMSPEQARGEGHRVDRRSDVFSLSVVFYELLVGRHPFIADTLAELIELITSFDPRPPRQYDDTIPKELDRICLKGLSKRASERYSTAVDMAEDLRHFLVSHSVHEPPVSHSRSTDPRAAIPIVPTGQLMHGSDSNALRIVPKGLRSFDARDADFFLELLPGPRDRDGLPDSLRFWISRIEETDVDQTFAVGLIYGPSGCGKSSFVKAGLLPRLSGDVTSIYVEATAQETETRLLNQLRKRCGDLSDASDLKESLAVLRRRQGTQAGKKVVIVIDQFEQWLHAKKDEQSTELVQALRQCDGGSVQCIVMVRDDFWMAATRFMRELEVRLVEGQNSAAIDLFPIRHAQKVLAAFGVAFGALGDTSSVAAAEQEQFIAQAVSGLAQEGKVISVQLALFAEMMKGKAWTPTTLAEVGGTAGIGVTFLEETFGAATTAPAHRLHQKAARGVLKALLPEMGSNIKGLMRSYDELLEFSGYQNRTKDFDDLIHLLDGELRLITPTDPEGKEESSVTLSKAGTKYYQLTHDYLVPSLREWLNRKLKETREGRAELLLEDWTNLWNSRQDYRPLPSIGEWIEILSFTAERNWTEPQRRMMQDAGNHHAKALVRRLLEAELADVSSIVSEINQNRKSTEPLLRQEYLAAAHESKAKLNTAIALLSTDNAVIDYLYERLLHAAPSEFPILRDALRDHSSKLRERLWSDAYAESGSEQLLRSACALAYYDRDNAQWGQLGDKVVQALTSLNPEFLAGWKDALRPVRKHLLGPLSRLFRRHDLGELQLALATSILADFASEDVVLLADLLCDANSNQFAVLFPVLARHGDLAIEVLQRELAKEAQHQWPDEQEHDSHSDINIKSTPRKLHVRDDALAALRHTMADSDGIMTDRFACCQTLAFSQLQKCLSDMQAIGYRPKCIRPYLAEGRIQVAAIWVRDNRPCSWLIDASAEEILSLDEELQSRGDVPTDVCVFQKASGAPSYCAIWTTREISDCKVRLVVGPLGDNEGRQLDELFETGYNCQTASSMFANEGDPHVGSIWTLRTDQKKSTTRCYFSSISDFNAQEFPGLLVTDVQIASCDFSESTQRQHGIVLTALWNISVEFESQVLHNLPIADHRDKALQLAADGYRPMSISIAPDLETVGGTLFAASVWHRPLIQEAVKDCLAKRQATAAAALLRLHREQLVWPLLKHSNDCRRRSYLIHRIGPLVSESRQIVSRLALEGDVSIRRALILILGEFNETHLASAERDRLALHLIDLYANDADPGIHAACAWTLCRWGRQGQVQQVDRQFATGKVEGSRRWYVNGQGQTLGIIGAPGEILMGSPPREPGREDGPEGEIEQLRYDRIDHDFAIMAHTVTVQEFLRFRADFYYRDTFSQEPTCPINNLNWYDCAAYCNWLNEQEGIPQEQWCYLPNERGEYAQGMRIAANCLQRTGYRLPTETEWEYACRAGSTTSRFYGENPDLDNHYAWTVQLALGRGTTSVGRFKPNDLGLFDMMGNIMEWLHDEFRDQTHTVAQIADDVTEEQLSVTDQQTRSVRPSCYTSTGSELNRSAAREVGVPPNARILLHSLRVGRTFLTHRCLDKELEVSNDQLRVVRGAPVMHSSRMIRSSYAVRYSPNFRLFAWGLRAARTIQ